MAGGAIIAGLYLSWRGRKAASEGSEAGCDSVSAGEVLQGTQVERSDNEPDALHLFAELLRGQQHLQRGIAALADVLTTRKVQPETPRNMFSFSEVLPPRRRRRRRRLRGSISPWRSWLSMRR